VVNLLVPNAEAMRLQLEHLFGGDLDGHHNGLIELAWTDTFPGKDGKYKLRHALMFGTDQFDELIEEAVRRNSVAYCNVYIGAALRKPETPPFGRASDSDVLALTCAYADLDDEGAGANMPLDCKPTMLVVTGLAPHARMQCWWRLIDPVTDREELKTLIRGIAVTIGGDETVVNPSRVMRLAGSIAWAQKPGRQVELTSIMPLRDPSQAVYEVPELMRRFPVPDHNLTITGYDQTAQTAQIPQTPVSSGQFVQGEVIRGATVVGLPGKVVDRRDVYMRNTVEAVMIQLIGELGRAPQPKELIDAVWVQYSAQADLNKAGKNIETVIQKCNYTLRRFAQGRISGCRNMAQAQAIYARKKANGGTRPLALPPPSPQGFDQNEFEQAKTTGNVYPFLDVDEILDSPDPVWMVDEIINERALGFVFGPPSSLKTFIALDLSLSIATKATSWWERKINQHGAVVYLCREGTSSFKYRIRAWELHRKTVARKNPFYLIKHQTNFMNPGDVAKVVSTVEAIMAKAGVPVAAVVVDTVSRVLPGAEENLQRDMSLFVHACELIQAHFNCILIGVHHTNKGGTIRGSNVIPGAGDFLIETRREPGAMTGSIVLQKVKDGEDGLELPFKVTKVELGTIVPRSSLAVDPAQAVFKDDGPKDGLPESNVCREILSELAAAWDRGAPWSHAPNSSRPAVRLIMNRWGLERKVAQSLLDHWMVNGVIEDTIYDSRYKVSGYHKLMSI
jgi:AAA domain